MPVAGAVPAAAAAIDEDDDPSGVLRHGRVAGQPDNAGIGLPLFLAAGWRVGAAGGARRAGLRQGRPRGGALQAGDDLVVRYLQEPGVELPDGEEPAWRVQADQLVGLRTDPCLPPRRRNGHGEHHPRRPLRPGDLAGGPHRGPGGDAVVDHHGDPAVSGSRGRRTR